LQFCKMKRVVEIWLHNNVNVLKTFVFGNTGVWTQGLMLLLYPLKPWASLPQLFLFVFPWGWSQTTHLLPEASQVAGIIGTCHHAWLVVWDGMISIIFCLELALNHDPVNLPRLLSSWDLQAWAAIPDLLHTIELYTWKLLRW
jgi:hypothetical protein